MNLTYISARKAKRTRYQYSLSNSNFTCTMVDRLNPILIISELQEKKQLKNLGLEELLIGLTFSFRLRFIYFPLSIGVPNCMLDHILHAHCGK